MKTEDGIEKEKEDCDIPIPIMVIALAIVISVALYIFTGFTQYESVSKLLEAHGSLIAGILGIVGVFILVRNQNKSTQKTVDATLRAIRLESFEIKRRAHIDDLIDVINIIYDTEIEETGCIDTNTLNTISAKVGKLHLLSEPGTSYRLYFLYNFLVHYEEVNNCFKEDNGVVELERSEWLNTNRLTLVEGLRFVKEELLIQEIDLLDHDYLDELFDIFTKDVVVDDQGKVDRNYIWDMSVHIYSLCTLLESIVHYHDLIRAETMVDIDNY